MRAAIVNDDALQRHFAFGDGDHLLLHCVLRDQPQAQHLAVLSNAVATSKCLNVAVRIEVRVEENDRVGCR